MSAIDGFADLCGAVSGDPELCIALLDGPVDTSHSCFAGARLDCVDGVAPARAARGPASCHGTRVASLLFGRGDVPGVAPDCRGLIVPIYSDDGPLKCGQVDLARALNQALDAGANIVNISGGQRSASPEADPRLERAVRSCVERGVLIVAAAGVSEPCS